MNKKDLKKLNSVQTIKPIFLEVYDPKKFKELKKRWNEHQKYYEKMFIKGMFTRWERIKIFFTRALK